MVWVLVPSLLTYPDSLLNSGNLHLTDTMPPWKKTCYLQYKERFLPPPAQNPTCTSDFSTGLLLCFIVIFKRILCKPRVGGQECIKLPRPSQSTRGLVESLAANWFPVRILKREHIWISEAHKACPAQEDSKVGLWFNRQEDRQKQCWSLVL